MTELLLEATGVAKRYGAVAALRSASLSVRAGEVHALMGANGAGKSTLVKILTGAVHPDEGTIPVRGEPYVARSPAEARQGGVVSVYQEPAVIPDLDIRSNLRLTKTPVEPFRHWLAELGIGDLDLSDMARDLPLATLRVIDLARALAIEPHVLMLDEMTAALPADLTERVLTSSGTSVARIAASSSSPTASSRSRRVRSGHGPARRRDRRRGRRQRRVRGADRRPHARRQRQDLATGAAPAPGGGPGGPTTPRLIARELRAGADSRTRPSNSVPARSSGWSRWKDRARTSCSMCSPGRAAPMAANCSSTVRRSRSGIPQTRSGPAWSTSPPTGPRRC